MKRVRLKYAILMSFVLLLGCLPSLRPLYTKDTIIFDEALIGKWYEKGGDNWTFIKDGENKYRLRVYEIDPCVAWFEVHLVQVGEHRFIDLYPGDEIDLENTPDMYSYNWVPAHTFIKLDFSEPNLLLQWVNFFDLCEWSPEVLKHEARIGGKYLITAKSEEIQRVLIENLDKVVEEEEMIFQKCPIDISTHETISDLNLLGRWESDDRYYMDIMPLEDRYKILFGDSQVQLTCQGVLYDFKKRLVLGIYAFTDDAEKNDLQKDMPPDNLCLIECDKKQLKIRHIKWDEVQDFMADSSKYSFENSEPDDVFQRVAD